MSDSLSIDAELVKSLSTKFYQQNDAACFQICLVYQDNSQYYYNFKDYNTYKNQHDGLVKAMHGKTKFTFNVTRK